MASEQISFDVSTIPQLPDLAEEVRRTRTTRLLKRDGETVAVLNPPASPAKRARRTMPTPKLADPHDIWKDYDPQQVRQAMHQARGSLAGVDTKTLIEDIYAQRAQDSSGRPAD
jgi:hypothetical protein